jgi:hypothetical protein
MDWYADNKHKQVCGIYEEYKAIPTKEMFKSEKGQDTDRDAELGSTRRLVISVSRS